ncbi:MAG TPA: hypothetical protein VLY04_22565 [Bryobacteraceae bacterium]|nr:hypothetical protein [Bryobacteraceae bacterium]
MSQRAAFGIVGACGTTGRAVGSTQLIAEPLYFLRIGALPISLQNLGKTLFFLLFRLQAGTQEWTRQV